MILKNLKNFLKKKKNAHFKLSPNYRLFVIMTSTETQQKQEEPLDLIRFQLDEEVLVKLRGAREMKGKLQGYDSHCNMVLSDAEEYKYDTEDTNKQPVVKKTEMVFVRGDSVILISPIGSV